MSSVYTFEIKPGIYYQPHPAFAQNEAGQYYYHQLNEKILEEDDIKTLSDFEHMGTRELIAEDYVYQIKRLLDTKDLVTKDDLQKIAPWKIACSLVWHIKRIYGYNIESVPSYRIKNEKTNN